MYKQHSTKTKTIATVGPACNNTEMLRKLIIEGVDVFRLNFSHGKREDHEAVIHMIKELNKELGTHIAILADLQGPKLRIGEVENNGQMLENGSQLKFVSEECIGNAERVYMSYKPLPLDVMPGETILVDDGKIKLEVIDTNRVDEVTLKVISGGILSSRKGVNLPNTNISLPSLTEKDIKDANFVLDFDIDWIALSFVRNAADILDLKDIIKKKKKNTKVVAKIEKPEAISDIDNIIDMTDGVMVARGDLGVEIPFDKVPVLQKEIVHKCILNAKPVIIATQMMESMITNFRPTRAEATDVSNAVVEGADAIMLSGETSVGKYPIEVIKSVQQIILATETNGYELLHEHKPDPKVPAFLPNVVSYEACKMANITEAKAIVIFTYSGRSAYQIASNRPNSKIFAFTPNQHVMSQLSLIKGLESFYLEPGSMINDSIEQASNILKKQGYAKSGDVIVFVGGIPMANKGPVNMMKIATIE
jgi:pyruvate kinase